MPPTISPTGGGFSAKCPYPIIFANISAPSFIYSMLFEFGSIDNTNGLFMCFWMLGYTIQG